VTYVPRSSGKVGEIAQFRDCRWENENYKNAMATAARHAAATGHTVSVEQTISVVFNPKEEKP